LVTVTEFPEDQNPNKARPKTASVRKATAEKEGGQPEEMQADGKALFRLDASLAPDDSAEARKVVPALQYIDSTPENIWREVGMALKAQWGDSAWDLFDEWSANGDGYDEHENRARWDSFRDEPDAGITLGTVFHYARRAGWKQYEKKSVV